MEDFEDDIVSMFSRGEKEPHEELCFKTAGVCPESEEASNDDSEPYDFEHEELWWNIEENWREGIYKQEMVLSYLNSHWVFENLILIKLEF